MDTARIYGEPGLMERSRVEAAFFSPACASEQLFSFYYFYYAGRTGRLLHASEVT